LALIELTPKELYTQDQRDCIRQLVFESGYDEYPMIGGPSPNAAVFSAIGSIVR